MPMTQDNKIKEQIDGDELNMKSSKDKQVKKEIKVRIEPRDKSMFLDLCKYKGLPLTHLADKYYKGIKKTCQNRLRQLEQAGYISKIYYVETKERKSLLRGPKRATIYYAKYPAQKAINYNLSNVRAERLKPLENHLEKHILLGKLDATIPNLTPSTESRLKYSIENNIPLTATIQSDKLITVSAFNRKDADKGGRAYNNLKPFIEEKRINPGNQAVMFVIIAPTFPIRFLLCDTYYLPWKQSPQILTNISMNTNYYKYSFLDVFINGGYSLLAKDGLFWQIAKNGTTYNIAELITGSTELMRALRKPPSNTYIYALSRSNLYGVNLEHGSFLLYSWKDGSTYQVTPAPGGKNHFEKLAKGVVKV